MAQLTKQDIVDAMTRSATGVTKVQPVAANVACSGPEALLLQLNNILKAKEPK